MTVRLKVTCTEKKISVEGESLTFLPVTSGSEENKAFFKWTPSGSIQFGTGNKAATSQFEVGKDYYVDFSPVG